jgi:hypothetical protein
MTHAFVRHIEYNYDGDNSLLQIEIHGVPTDILAKAHSISQEILGQAPWHFVGIEMNPPKEADAVNSDREWIGIFKATFK